MLQFSHSIRLFLRPASVHLFLLQALKNNNALRSNVSRRRNNRRVRCSDVRERPRNTDRLGTIMVETVCLYRQRINISLGIAQADTLTQVENGRIRVPSPTICSTRVLRYHACNARPIVPSRIRYTRP